jgi:phenylalanine ammonia-lyase
MLAAYLLALCQALDLRVMNIKFLENLKPRFFITLVEYFEKLLHEVEKLSTLQVSLWETFKVRLEQNSPIDTAKRFTYAIESLQPILLRVLCPSTESAMAIQSWSNTCSSLALQVFQVNRDQYFSKPDATPYLGVASRQVNIFIRNRLGVPFLREEAIRAPENESLEYQHTKIPVPVTIGSLITTIYQSIRSGGFYSVVVDCLQEVSQQYLQNVKG